MFGGKRRAMLQALRSMTPNAGSVCQRVRARVAPPGCVPAHLLTHLYPALLPALPPACHSACAMRSGLCFLPACPPRMGSELSPTCPCHAFHAQQMSGTRGTAPLGGGAGWACATTNSIRVGGAQAGRAQRALHRQQAGLASLLRAPRVAPRGAHSPPLQTRTTPATPAFPHTHLPAPPTPPTHPPAGAYYLNLLWNYYLTPGLYRPDALIAEPLIFDAARLLVDVWVREQRHNESSPYRFHELGNGGLGPSVEFTGGCGALGWEGS